MNPITLAVNSIKYKIPKEILIEVFAPKVYNWFATQANYEEELTRIVIRGRVMVDCDLVGGTEVFIALWDVPSQVLSTDRLMTVYHIPKSKTQGRTITSVLSLSYVSGAASSYMNTANAFDPCTVTDLNLAASAMLDAAGGTPLPSSAKVQLIGENTVMVKDTVTSAGVGLLRCILANDENMSNIQPRSIPAFSKLCELAVKSYVYNQFIITMDKGRLEGGAELGRFREVIDSYSDAEEQYQDYLLNTWQKVAFMNDRESYERFTKMMIGAYR